MFIRVHSWFKKTTGGGGSRRPEPSNHLARTLIGTDRIGRSLAPHLKNEPNDVFRTQNHSCLFVSIRGSKKTTGGGGSRRPEPSNPLARTLTDTDRIGRSLAPPFKKQNLTMYSELKTIRVYSCPLVVPKNNGRGRLPPTRTL